MSTVTYELENHIAVITLNRPDALNSFNIDMYREFNRAMERFREEDEAWVAVITSSGDRAFSAGVDIKELDKSVYGADDEENRKNLEEFDIELEGEYFCDKPIIAAIKGYCIGEGLVLALSCDLRISGESAIFALPESKIGMPTINGAIHSTNLIGVANTLEMVLFGEHHDANWAYRTGLVNLVVEDSDVIEKAMEWAQKIAALSPLALQISKEAAVKSQYLAFDEVVKNASKRKEHLFTTNDAKEGARAFLENRAPRFTNS